MRSVKVSEPGKVILFGEHFVVHGSKAVAFAINKFVDVSITESSEFKIKIDFQGDSVIKDKLVQYPPASPNKNAFLKYIINTASRFDIANIRIDVKVNFPIAAGLGSSAAIAAAVAKALYLYKYGASPNREFIYEVANRLEREIHGTPSGIDLNTILEKGIILYDGSRRQVISRLSKGEFTFVISDTTDRRVTGKLVKSVSMMKDKMGHLFNAFISLIDKVSSEGFNLLAKNDVENVGKLMTVNHGLLFAIGVSTPKLDHLVYKALDLGAYGAKLTGAGGGGCMICLCDPIKAKEIAASFNSLGYPSFIVKPYYG